MLNKDGVIIDKVITVLLDFNDLEAITNNFETTDYWVDKSYVEDNPVCKQFLTDKELEALNNGEADYIAFRIDE